MDSGRDGVLHNHFKYRLACALNRVQSRSSSVDLHTSILHGVHTSSFSGFICFHMKHTILHPYRCFGLLGIGLGAGLGAGTAPTLKIGWKARVHDSSIFPGVSFFPLSYK